MFTVPYHKLERTSEIICTNHCYTYNAMQTIAHMYSCTQLQNKEC